MKVYVKKDNKNTMIPGIIATIVFFLFPIGIFIMIMRSGKSFIDILTSSGDALLFAIIFFTFDIYFIYLLTKKPKPYIVKLMDKKIETYHSKQITYMTFSAYKKHKQEEDFIPSVYRCYTIGENDLIIGNEYSLKIKEFNWEPKYVEEINNFYPNNKTKVANKIPNMTLSPVVFSIELLLLANLFFCIPGIIMYPEYTFTYIIAAIFFIAASFTTLKLNKIWKIDNNIETNEQDLTLKLDKIKPIDNHQEKIGNLTIKHLLILLVAIPLVYFMIILKMNVTEFIDSLPIILIVEAPFFLITLFHIGGDEVFIKKHNIKITDTINISKVTYFNIFRATKSITFPQYFIIDQNKNLIFKIQKSNLIGNKFVVCDSHNIKIAEITSKLFSLTNEFVINIVDETPFIIRSKMQLHTNYQVIGRDYSIKGDTHLIRNIIYDNNENDIAYISAISEHNNNWHTLDNMEITLNSNVNNNIDIIMMALCVTLGNLQTIRKKFNR